MDIFEKAIGMDAEWLLKSLEPEAEYEEIFCRMCKSAYRDQIELEMKKHMAEKLYSILGNGRRLKKVTLEDCMDVFDVYAGLSDFANYGIEGFSERFGLSKVQKQRLRELGNTYIQNEYSKYNGTVVRMWKDAASFFVDKFDGDDREHVIILYLDTNGVVAGMYKTEGRCSEVYVDLSIIRDHRPYLDEACCFVVHNHPNSSAMPSMSDHRMYSVLNHFLNTPEMRLMDCLIVSGNTVHSIKYGINKFFSPSMLLDK